MTPLNPSDGPTPADSATELYPSLEENLGAWAPLRHPNYRLFFGGQLISLIGTWTQNVAQSWLIYRLTGSSLHLGLVAFMGQVPVFALALLGGTIADRFNRRRMLVGTQATAMLLALILAALTLAHLVREWHVILLAFCLGVVNAVDMPTRQSFVVEMVDRRVLHQAIGLNSAMFNGARIAGPTLAGWLVAAVGEGWCFLINGLTFLAVIISLLLMRLPAQPRLAKPEGYSTSKQIREGVGYVWRHQSMRNLLALLCLTSLLGAPYLVMMPIFAGRILHGGPTALGLLMGASGLGALLGALGLATRRGSGGLENWPYAAATSLGLCLVLFSLSTNLWLSLALLVPTGCSMMLQAASTNSVLQYLAPDHLRGRVMSIYVMMFMGTMPFGSLLAGVIAHSLGAPLMVRLGGAACLLVGLTLLLRKLRRPAASAQGPQPS